MSLVNTSTIQSENCGNEKVRINKLITSCIILSSILALAQSMCPLKKVKGVLVSLWFNKEKRGNSFAYPLVFAVLLAYLPTKSATWTRTGG